MTTAYFKHGSGNSYEIVSNTIFNEDSVRFIVLNNWNEIGTPLKRLQ